jgi:acyl-CoA synthetase (NDP forming)
MKETDSAPDGLERLFCPRSVAVVGASRNPDKVGHMVLSNIHEGGFAGDVYAVNPKADEILGLQAYPSLSSVPSDLDLVVVVVPAPYVPRVVREAAEMGVGAAVVLSGGFREAGRADLEEELSAIVRETDLRIVGPNCQGINYLPSRLLASFWFPRVLPGPMAVASQSGTVAATLAGWATDDLFGVSATVCLGNQVDICESDLMSFFAHDPQTDVMAFYLEGAKDGPRFVSVLKRVAPKKPIVILKSGRTVEGKRAASSHTRSLAGRDEVFDAACRQFGVVRVASLESLYDSAKALSMLVPPRGNRLVIVTSTGGAGILAVDEAERSGLQLSSLPSSLIDELQEADLPRNAVFSNPLDLTVCSADDFETAMLLLNRYDVADVYLLIFGDPIKGAATAVEKINARIRGSVAVAFLGGGEIEKAERPCMQAAGIPVYPTPERAVDAIAAAVWWHSRSRALVDADRSR